MALTSPSQAASGEGSAKTLAGALACGPLSLSDALHYAMEVALLLQIVHQRDRSYGRVAAENVLVCDWGVELAPSPGHRDEGGRERDIQKFGALLYQMVIGAPVPGNASEALFPPAGNAATREAVEAAAVRLAGECMGHLPVERSTQQIAKEVRLLWLAARKLGADGARKRETPAPFLVKPPAPPTPPAPEPPPIHIPASSRTVAPEPMNPGTLDAKPSESEPVDRKCPKCGNPTVYTSRPNSDSERRMVKLGVPICLCRQCYHRFMVVAGISIGKAFQWD